MINVGVVQVCLNPINQINVGVVLIWYGCSHDDDVAY